MKRSHSFKFWQGFAALLCVLVLMFYTYPIVKTSAQARDAADAVQDAWAQAQKAGSYRYSTDIVQTTTPKATVTNIGRQSTQSALHIEGESDLPAQLMTMHLWSDEGNVQDASTGTEVRIENDRALARTSTGEWQEIDNFTDLFAPQGDFMAFLAAAKDIVDQGTETRQIATGQLNFTRYTFRIDGLSYARYLRKQIQQQMNENHELPAGINLDLPRQYVDMIGEGELWIGSDGLPLRQIVQLQMLESADEQVTADVTVDFYDFGYANSTASTAPAAGRKVLGMTLPSSITWGKVACTLRQLSALASLIFLIVLMVTHARSKKLYTALAIAVVFSTVSTPLLQSLHVAGFYKQQVEQQQAQAARQEESEMMRELNRMQSASTSTDRVHHPNRSPLNPIMLPGYMLSTSAGTSNCQHDDGTDTDGDGLTDCQEGLLDTNPNGEDSDGDTLSDALEVQGFSYNGKIWYTDPLELDTNKDGLTDFQEWNLSDSEHAYWDLDNDGMPDLFDDDNDGDGVPDSLDISPATQSTNTFDNQNPLLFQIDNLEEGLPTYVEFQLRPTNLDHLWYAMNVLDWPEDRRAQIQDDDNKTFHDVDNSLPSSPNANGDIKLVPMLEIQVSGAYTNLPSAAELEHYGAFIMDASEDGSEKAVYVPLNIISDTDDEGNVRSRVAFYGKMFYRPDAAWGDAQQVRLVWLVQALVDRCAEDGYEDGMCKTYEAYNELQVIHTYYDAWTLTGLQVREDHGVDMAFIYEDPAVDPYLNDDAALFALTYGLDHTFLAARDVNDDNTRDLDINEIYRRFNHTTNLAATEEERWGITNTLGVEIHTYEHLDEALMTIAMTDTEALLERVFTPYWSESSPITPSIMFAREEHARIVNLDLTSSDDEGLVVWDTEQEQLRIDLHSSDAGDAPFGNSVQVMTTAGIRWSPYRFRAGWEGCPLDEYWDELEQRYPYDDEPDPEQAAGMTFFTQLYYLGIYQGVDSLVQLGDVLLENTAAWADPIVTITESGAKLGGALIKFISKKVISAIKGTNPFSDSTRIWKFLGLLSTYENITNWAKDLKIVKFFKWAFSKEGWGVGVALVIGAIMVLLAVAIIAGITVLILDSVGWLQPIISAFQYVYQMQWVQTTIYVATAIWNFVSPVVQFIFTLISVVNATSLWSSVISLIFEVAIVWIVFLVQALVSGYAFGSIALNTLFATALAATVLAILLFVFVVVVAAIFTVGIGLLIGAIVSLLLGIAEAIGFFWNFSVTEWLTRKAAELVYYSAPMVTQTVDVIPQPGGGTLLEDPKAGFVAGNKVQVAMRVKTALQTQPFGWFQNVTNLASWCHDYHITPYFNLTDFKYALAEGVISADTQEVVPSDDVVYPQAETWSTNWNQKHTGTYMSTILLTGQTEQDIQLDEYVTLEAGVNSHVPILFLTSYTMPAIEYFGFIVYYCHIRQLEGETYSDAGIVYDVFPATLDEFYQLEGTPFSKAGLHLAWDDDFNALMDADGDGLLAYAYNGIDYFDNKWDTDSDGLADGYEAALSETGVRVSILNSDYDGDGLSDAEELRAGSDPVQADTDGDGLTDDVEVHGWAFTYGQNPTLQTWVTSDPTQADTDGDGMNDNVEKILHAENAADYPFHPRVANASPVAVYTAIDDVDGVVTPGTTLAYTVTVQNKLDTPYYATGDLVVGFPTILKHGDISHNNFTLFMGQALTLTADVPVDTNTSSQAVNIVNQVDVQLVNNPACARVSFNILHCTSEADTDIPWWYTVDGSEVVVRLDDSNVWYSWPDKVLAGQDWDLNADLAFCNQSTILVLEDDDGEEDDDTLETWSISAQNPGDFTHAIDDLSAHFVGDLNYEVYYPGNLNINFTQNQPVIVDADLPSSEVTSLADGQYLQGTGETLIIGGIAEDPTSSVVFVGISVDNGEWEQVNGTSAWAWGWQVPLQAGTYTLYTRATDVVGHTFTDTVGTTIIVDIYPPDITTPIENGAIVTATQHAGGTWSVPLYGSVQDLLDFGGDPGSDVRTVQVLLEGQNDVAGQGWQTATLTSLGGTSWAWNLDYQLPTKNNADELLVDPSGEYIFIVRASDSVGNVSHSPLAINLRLDTTPPEASITDTGLGEVNTVITGALTISGPIIDPGVTAAGIAGLEIAYTPIEIASTLSPVDIDLLFHLDEATGTTIFHDAAGYNYGTCIGDTCPTAGQSGLDGTTVRFDGIDDYINIPDLPDSDALTIGMWLKISELPSSLRSLLHHDGWNLGNVHLHLVTDGQLEFALNGNSPLTAYSNVIFDASTFDQWVHVVYVYDTGQKQVAFYVNGNLDTVENFTTALPGDLGPGQIGNWRDGDRPFDGMMDEIVIFNRALSDSEVKTLYTIGREGQPWLNWQPATLAESGKGIIQTTWSHVIPDNLNEGFYQIDLRATDVLSNHNATVSTWPQWQGEIDTYAPQVSVEFELTGTGDTARTEYICTAEDFNLVQEGFECPCAVLPSDRTAYTSEWWSTWMSDTTRLYRIETTCLVPGHQAASKAYIRAYDRYGKTSEDAPNFTLRARDAITSPLDTVIFTPTYGSVFTSTDPIAVAGGVYAERTLGLKALTVTVDSAIIYTGTWTPGSYYGGQWATTWPTPVEGTHTLLAVVADHHGYVQTATRPITFYVDTLMPDIAFPTDVLTSAHRISSGHLILTAPYTETGGVDTIQVKEVGTSSEENWQTVMVIGEHTWRYAWQPDATPDNMPLLDGATYTFTGRITDVAGRTTQVTDTIYVDVTPPEPVTVTLAYTNSTGIRTPILSGQTISDVVSPTLFITWTASSDGSGLAGYDVGWSTSEFPAQADLTAYNTTDARHHIQQINDGQVLYAHIIARDIHGNEEQHTFGPLYADFRTTPVLTTTLDYHGWMDNGCSQIGADRELARYAQPGQANNAIQRLYTTWNTDTLRLTWTGADWNNDGDLFIYFDTQTGGATTVYNPYTTTTTINLPVVAGQPMAADHILWIEDADTASLLTWNGTTWLEAITDTLSVAPYYQLDTSLLPAYTDLALPFNWLGITDAHAISEWHAIHMVAFATEENALRLWAAMPDKNPLNSTLAINTLAEVMAVQSFTLTQAYTWPALESDTCPNAGQFTDADLHLTLTADPPGVEVGYLEHDLLYLAPGQDLDTDLDGKPDVALPLDSASDLVGHGQMITYTLHYANYGTEVASNVNITVTSRGAMWLSGTTPPMTGYPSPLTLTLETIPPGVSETLEFTGLVFVATYTTSVEIQAVATDPVHGEFDWFWVQHNVDNTAPESVDIVAPTTYLKPYTNTVRGTVNDESGASYLILEARTIPTDTLSTYPFNDATPKDGQWAYAWNIGAADNGNQFRIRPQATDRFGNGPTVGDWVTLTVDSRPPTITLDAASDMALQGVVFNQDTQALLTGKVEDDQQASGMEICFGATSDAYCEQVAAQPGTAITGTWRYALKATADLDHEDLDFYLCGLDGAGNRSTGTLSRTYTVDTVPPVVTVETQVDSIAGLSPRLVLSGTVTDGSGISELYILLTPPGGSISSTLAAQYGDAWSYTLFPTTVGTYTLRLEARDAQGNASGYGPFEVVVVEDIVSILVVSPVNGATDVAHDRPLQIVFSKPMLTDTVTVPIITPTLALMPTWSAEAITLTLHHPPFTAEQRYTVTVIEGTNLNGTSLNNTPYIWSFTTGPRSETYIYLPLVLRTASSF
ncbi:MAG: Ig-like domain-containing protein [Anaerolineae bacterium]|nr:Ig-like domain-containing protein [Anaerolineae bacterium]